MGSDRPDDEHDEYDPEEEFRDPESDSLTIPRVSTEDAGGGIWSDIREDFESEEPAEPDISTDETDVPTELRETFWAMVLFVNGAVLTYALAALFLVFEGATRTAGMLFAIGLACTVFTARRYRHYQRYVDANDDESESDASSDAGDAAAPETNDDT
ncbi:hypothetical protein Htur_1497 [Haloterrigena turkmenica DSM 5511]|uniref:DUF7322 domain-containing protein n=1 Tax=Haloterrigena turkmenica (strain ATCC 51198 / DSM 5511 / JCM 9101 / NCIMB 13204 / VKM B-1734 / 4k) TaxID=543526 RepID=D2RQQ2_HALTV|nr:hypothetical protein [Haloterrigena turkmenica]ADB60383.1 hypothetical protein Htur_1497 [Haloterrigena turkmenica DSM 5511]